MHLIYFKLYITMPAEVSRNNLYQTD